MSQDASQAAADSGSTELRGRRRRIAGAIAAAGALAVVAVIVSRKSTSRHSVPAPPDLSLPAVAKSPFLNTGPDAQYLGSASCERCHPDSHQSYAASAMSQSMAQVNLERAPPDGAFEHPLSGQRLSVYRQDGQLRQRLVLTGTSDNGAEVLADHPVKYVVGSGHFSKTYLSEIDDFLVEAPLTWYAETGRWGMSPGFDQAAHLGFEREATERCVGCHSGRVEVLDGSLHRFQIHELAIGCERCHGPGSIHVDFWNAHRGEPARQPTSGSVDYTIVNPAHLPRALAEAVCQQCHFTSSAQVVARGRSLSQFRPGLPLDDFLISYRLDDPDESMKVTGHVEQLSLSRCYQKSETLTCTTCHDPHDNPTREERTAYYRSMCLNCHTLSDCRVDPAARAAQSAENDCTACHMPAAPTEIVHLAFTHHRIGFHGRPRDGKAKEPPIDAKLEPVHDLSRWGEVDRVRSLGLAYFERALHRGAHSLICIVRAQELLEHVRSMGLREGQVDAALAHMVSRTNDPAAPVYAASALNDPELPVASRILALSVLAQDHYQKHELNLAVARLHELTGIRRASQDWLLLGNCEAARQDFVKAREAFETAVAINPKLVAAHVALARLYAREGDEEKARRQQELAARMEQILKTPAGAP